MSAILRNGECTNNDGYQACESPKDSEGLHDDKFVS